MPTKIFWIHDFENKGRLGIMARPRGGDWLNDEIIHLKSRGVNILVCLLEYEETSELELLDEQQICRDNNIEYINHPIVDRSVPTNHQNVNTLITYLLKKFLEGSSIVIHCRMGIGRSSIIAGAILKSLDFKTPAILAQIKSVRGMPVPDTDEQIKWLSNFNIGAH